MSYLQELRGLVGSRELITVGAGILMIDGQDRLLLQLRSDNGLWGIPGGGMEPGETVEETARREVLEETGLRAGVVSLFGVYSGPALCYTYPNGDRIVNVSIVFRCTDWTGELTAEPGESEELRFFAREAVPDALNPTSIPVIRDFVEGRNPIGG